MTRDSASCIPTSLYMGLISITDHEMSKGAAGKNGSSRTERKRIIGSDNVSPDLVTEERAESRNCTKLGLCK